MFTVYALYSRSFDKIYVGYTHNFEERLIDHNSRAKKGFTVRFRPWILVYSETFNNKPDALKREKELKSFQGRKFVWSQVRLFLLNDI
jgi:putative endonuclease